jgi:8-oxo-dGTP pyrophosphatase MutT (NUDIX family)
MDELFQGLKDILDKREKNRLIKPEKTIASSVVILLMKKENEYFILLTKRTNHVFQHKNEISFPGGVFEIEDKTLDKTAIRETSEELGINYESIKILGELDDFKTVTNYIISPFVGYLERSAEFNFSKQEIEYLIYLPIEILKKHKFEIRQFSYNNKNYDSYVLEFNNELIWGATARILKHFKEVCL